MRYRKYRLERDSNCVEILSCYELTVFPSSIWNWTEMQQSNCAGWCKGWYSNGLKETCFQVIFG